MSAQEPSDSVVPDSVAQKNNSSQFVGFQIAEQEYAFRIEQIQEIVILDQVTKTPQVPEYVEGVSNLRGTIIPIINLRMLFGLEPKAADSESRTIVDSSGKPVKVVKFASDVTEQKLAAVENAGQMAAIKLQDLMARFNV